MAHPYSNTWPYSQARFQQQPHHTAIYKHDSDISIPAPKSKPMPCYCAMQSQYSIFNVLSGTKPVKDAAVSFRSQPFAVNSTRKRTPKPIKALSPNSALQSLKSLISDQTHEKDPSSHEFKVLPFTKGKPLAGYRADGPGPQKWHLGWLSLSECKSLMEDPELGVLNEESLVYLGCENEGSEGKVYWAIDVSKDSRFSTQLRAKNLSFVELKTLMVATDFSSNDSLDELAIAGHGRALLEWHTMAQFCGHCGAKAVSIEAGRRKQCSNKSCRKKTYPRVDPVVIMLVIDEENDRVLLSRHSRYAPRKWTCLAGFIEPGESLEEAVRRETREETGIEIGDVMYHSSQPWPVGRSTMPCQLMVGFFAYAKSLEISVDKDELENAKWHSRDDVRKALALAVYDKARRKAVDEIEHMCRGVEKDCDAELESGDVAPMFVPGPHAIAHHLISCWANGDDDVWRRSNR